MNNDMQVVYVIDPQQGDSNQTCIATDDPPYDKDGNLIQGIKVCTAIVVERDRLRSTGIKGIHQIYTNPNLHMHFPIPSDAKNPDFYSAIQSYKTSFNSSIQTTLTGISR
ncbi:MAG: hypothetical protein LW855_01615 [Alphaproteobacteria bacterium]|nr:hypothetical protein [Alphaproteobacteria bacterium]